MENLNLLFYKTFYSELGKEKYEEDIKQKAERLVSATFSEKDYRFINKSIASEKFIMKTSYPGLLAGTGYAHGVDCEYDIKTGFSFDYVTGKPYIPSSSVKGLLKSYFEYPEVINTLLGSDYSSDFIRALSDDIFEDNEDLSKEKDIFFDAVIRCADKNGHILGFDSITPHGSDLTKNPTPIRIIKVLPDVFFEFNFRLRPSKIGDVDFSIEKKQKLFIDILENFGIGAKTNVGYGALKYYSDKDFITYINQRENSIVSNATDNNRRNQGNGYSQGYKKNRGNQNNKGNNYSSPFNYGNTKKKF